MAARSRRPNKGLSGSACRLAWSMTRLAVVRAAPFQHPRPALSPPLLGSRLSRRDGLGALTAWAGSEDPAQSVVRGGVCIWADPPSPATTAGHFGPERTADTAQAG